jgi:hypothetical protein
MYGQTNKPDKLQGITPCVKRFDSFDNMLYRVIFSMVLFWFQQSNIYWVFVQRMLGTLFS